MMTTEMRVYGMANNSCEPKMLHVYMFDKDAYFDYGDILDAYFGRAKCVQEVLDLIHKTEEFTQYKPVMDIEYVDITQDGPWTGPALLLARSVLDRDGTIKFVKECRKCIKNHPEEKDNLPDWETFDDWMRYEIFPKFGGHLV